MTQDLFIQSQLEQFDEKLQTTGDGGFWWGNNELNPRAIRSFLASSLRAAMAEGVRMAIEELEKGYARNGMPVKYRDSQRNTIVELLSTLEKPNEGTA